MINYIKQFLNKLHYVYMLKSFKLDKIIQSNFDQIFENKQRKNLLKLIF